MVIVSSKRIGVPGLVHASLGLVLLDNEIRVQGVIEMATNL